MKKKNIRRITILVLVAILGFGAYYVNDYYHAADSQIEEFEVENEVHVEISEGVITCKPIEPVAGMIFYPGGKVEYTAYLPLMEACASNGILSILVEMPFNLAVMDINAADGLRENYPDITNWYMAGHSLGGSMAGSYIAEHETSYEGLILLGSYVTEELNESDLQVLSLYGSEDKVMKMDKYIEYKNNLPANLKEEIIEGGNHAGFGMYGAQEGDGTATLTNEEQILTTAEIIREFIYE